MGLMVATRAFFKLLTNRELSNKFDDFVSGKATPAIESPPTPAPKPVTTKQIESGRSDAISLLSSLQREARLIDLIHESLDAYSDAQVGTAARDVLRDSRKVLDRMFSLAPLTDAEDGHTVTTPQPFDPAAWRLTGNVAGEAPYTGQVMHHGWKATRCDVPKFTGDPSAALIVAPAEIELN